MIRLARYLKYYKKEVIIGPIFKFIEAVFELIVPILMAKIIDIGIKNKDNVYILKMGGLMVLLGVLGLLFALVCQYLASKASQGIGTRLRNDLFKHINTLSHTEIDKLTTSSLINRITNDVNQIQLAVAMLIRIVIRAPFLVLGATVMAMSIDLKMSIIFWVCGIFIALTLYIIMKKSVPLYKVIQKKLDKVGLITKENLEGVRVIRAFTKQDYEEKRFENACDDHLNTAVLVGKLSALLNPITTAITNIGLVLIIAFGGISVNIGVLNQGEIIAFVDYMMQILLALVVVATIVIIFTKASASAKRINEVFDTVSSIKENNKNDIKLNENAPLIEFKNVYFSYGESSEYALEDISFKIRENETVGIIGATGSGKSTIVNLIARFYDCKKGEILINGVNIKNLSFKQLREIVSIVAQKVILFSGTILDNLKIADKNATNEKIENALKIAQLKEYVDSLSNGYNTVLNEAGKNLSGGQRQRLTIARALVKNSKILILDDSLSALDYKTDKNLRKALRENLKNTAVITVSQRVNTIKNCDKIIVIDDGKIVGIDNHKTLIENCDVYKDICISQNIDLINDKGDKI